MKNLFTLVLLAAVASSPAFGAPRKAVTFSCTSRAQIDASTEECADNEAYAEAGVLCVNKLKELVDKKTAEAKKKLGSSNEAHMSDAVKSQKNAMGGAASNYGISQDTLDELLSSARQAKQQVSKYLDDLYMPEELALAEETGNPEEILKNEPCYNDNREVLTWVEEDIDKIIAELTAAKVASSALDAHSTTRETHADSLSPAATSTTNQGTSGAGSAVKPKNWRPSDISGTQDKKAPAKK